MRRIKKHFNVYILFFLTVICLFPFVYLFIGSTNDSSWIFTSSINFEFGSSFWNNLINLQNRYPFLIIFMNSLISATFVTIISILLIVMFIFSSLFLFKRLSSFLDILFVVFLFLPTSSHFIGSIYVISAVDLRDTIFGLVIPFLINLRIYFYLKEEFKVLSQEVIDSMLMDGANAFKIIWEVFLGIYKDKLIFSMFLLFVSSWNNFIIPLNIISQTHQFTLPILIASLADPLNYFLGETFVALLFQTLPLILSYTYFARYMNINSVN